MGRLLGYMASRADRLRDVLLEQGDALGQPSSKGFDGWGIGFYQGGEVLHKKRPQSGGTAPSWAEVAQDVRSHCAIAHIREATVGDFTADNTHPFRMRQWLFAHNGTVDRFQAIRAQSLESMPDFLRRDIRGETDSEHVFHMILAFLHDAGQLDNPEIDDKTVLSAIRATVSLLDQMTAEVSGKPATLNLVLTNGQRMYALRRGKPMVYEKRVDPPGGPSRTGHPSRSGEGSDGGLRYVLIVSDGPSTPPGYTELEESSVLVVDRDLRVVIHSL